MLLVCRRCATRYAMGLPYCPRCTSMDHRVEGEEKQVAKISVHGGPTNAAETQGPEAASAAPMSEEAGEQPSPGSSSAASGGKPPSSGKPSSSSPPKPARTTGRHSGKARAESSSARSDATTSGPGTGDGETP